MWDSVYIFTIAIEAIDHMWLLPTHVITQNKYPNIYCYSAVLTCILF